MVLPAHDAHVAPYDRRTSGLWLPQAFLFLSAPAVDGFHIPQVAYPAGGLASRMDSPSLYLAKLPGGGHFSALGPLFPQLIDHHGRSS